MLLYRYRSIDSAVKELSSSSFYFASKEELNDPLESYVRLYWKGDKPAWEGLFRNYACSLFNALETYLLAGDKQKLHNNTVMINIHAFDSLPMGAILKDIGEQFLCIEPVQLLTDYYGNNNLKCGTKELIVILRSVYELALRICIDKMVDEHLMPVDQAEIVYKSIKQTPETAIDLLKAGCENGKNDILIEMDESKRRQFFSDMEGMSEDAIEQQLIMLDSKITDKKTGEGDSNDTEEFLYQNKDSEKGAQARNWIEIRANYPKLYVNQLKNIVFPEAYVVCFSKNNNDSSGLPIGAMYAG